MSEPAINLVCIACGKHAVTQLRKTLKQLDSECAACAARKRQSMEQYALQREREIQKEIDDFWKSPEKQAQAERDASALWPE